MHPLIDEQMAYMRRQELLHEAVMARCADLIYIKGNRDMNWPGRERWSLIFGLPVVSASINQAWLQRRMHATIRTVSFGAFGAGSLVGSFLGSRFGLLPAVVFSCIVCSLITLPVLARLLKGLRASQTSFSSSPPRRKKE